MDADPTANTPAGVENRGVFGVDLPQLGGLFN